MSKYFIGIPIENNDILSKHKNKKDVHLTVKYLGNKTDDELKTIINKLNRFSHSAKSFNMSGDTFERFGKRFPHLTIDNNYRLNKVLSTFNKDNDGNRKIVPHITIGASNTRLPKSRDIDIPVNKLTLYKIKDNINFKDHSAQHYDDVADFKLPERNVIDKSLDFFRNIPYWRIFN